MYYTTNHIWFASKNLICGDIRPLVKLTPHTSSISSLHHVGQSSIITIIDSPQARPAPHQSSKWRNIKGRGRVVGLWGWTGWFPLASWSQDEKGDMELAEKPSPMYCGRKWGGSSLLTSIIYSIVGDKRPRCRCLFSGILGGGRRRAFYDEIQPYSGFGAREVATL